MKTLRKICYGYIIACIVAVVLAIVAKVAVALWSEPLSASIPMLLLVGVLVAYLILVFTSGNNENDCW